MISTTLDFLTSPPGQVLMGSVLVLVILPAVGWKLWMDAVNPREREHSNRDRRG